MGLADLAKAGVALAERIAGDFVVDVEHSVWIGQSVSGEATYESAVTRRALVQPASRRFVAADGTERMATTKITLLDGAAIEPRDQLTLPDGRTPPLITVEAPPLASDGSALLWTVWAG